MEPETKIRMNYIVPMYAAFRPYLHCCGAKALVFVYVLYCPTAHALYAS